jgi:hypothetical protein
MIDKNYLVESKVIPINANVSDDKLFPYMYPSFDQLRATLPIALYTALDALAEEYVKQWSVTNSYVATNKANYTEVGVLKMWQSVGTNSDSKPTTANTADWLELELGTFLVNYVQPFLGLATYYGYAVNGGVNSSHQGLQRISNETAQALTGTDLQSFLNFWKNQKDLKRRSMLNYLDDKSNLLDGVTYTAIEASKKKTSFQIRGIGRKIGEDTSRIIDYGSTY